MERLEKSKWLSEGLKIIETEGFARITVDNLCEKLQRSKGSFYFHFKNMDGYVEALMEYWLEENTFSIIREVNDLKQIKLKKRLADKLALTRSSKLGMNIRAWGYSNDNVKKVVCEADRIRTEYLTELGIQEGKDKTLAKEIAMLTYAVYIGLQQLYPDLSQTEKTRLEQLFSSKF